MKRKPKKIKDLQGAGMGLPPRSTLTYTTSTTDRDFGVSTKEKE